MSRLDASPVQFAQHLLAAGLRRTWLVRDRERGGYRAPDAAPAELVAFLDRGTGEFGEPEAVFLGVGPESRALFGVFLHSTRRGQGQGGARRSHYADVGAFLRDGLRLAQGMTRKNALAGLWWGGGKAVLDAGPGEPRDPARRRILYREFGDFVSSLRGCYVTAEDAGTSPDDMAQIFRRTRFATCVPVERGGSGNPAGRTAAGVVCAMEAALESAGISSLANRCVVIQGAGNVGTALIGMLLSKGVSRIVASEVAPERRASALDAFSGEPVEVRAARVGLDAILAEPCDVLAPCALGGVLSPKTIPGIRARVVCGAANNPLEDEDRDGRALAEQGILYVPDFLANRMGIVACANEQYGVLVEDPAVERHLDRAYPEGIHLTTRRVLAHAKRDRVPPVTAAHRLADALAAKPHPIFPGRAARVIRELVESGWERSG